MPTSFVPAAGRIRQESKQKLLLPPSRPTMIDRWARTHSRTDHVQGQLPTKVARHCSICDSQPRRPRENENKKFPLAEEFDCTWWVDWHGRAEVRSPLADFIVTLMIREAGKRQKACARSCPINKNGNLTYSNYNFGEQVKNSLSKYICLHIRKILCNIKFFRLARNKNENKTRPDGLRKINLQQVCWQLSEINIQQTGVLFLTHLIFLVYRKLNVVSFVHMYRRFRQCYPTNPYTKLIYYY